MDDTRRAEEALVGALALTPDRLHEVKGWLHRTDFGSPACGLLFERIQQVAERGVDPRGARLLEALRSKGELRRDGYPVTALTEWIAAAPSSPPVGVYGAVVLEGGLGRQVEAAGTRLLQAASGSVAPRAVAAVLSAQATLTAAHRRWCALPPAVRLATEAPRAAGPRIAGRSALPRGGAAGPGARVARVSRDDHAELVTLGSLLVASHFERRVAWLQPEDFASSDHARVFAAIRAMTGLGRAVDRVTVATELHHRGARPARGDWDSLLRRSEAAVPLPSSVGFYARQVLDDAVLTEVATVGRRLVELGRDRPGGAPAMLGAALAELDGLRDVSRRLRRSRVVGASRPALAQRPSAPAAERQRTDRIAG